MGVTLVGGAKLGPATLTQAEIVESLEAYAVRASEVKVTGGVMVGDIPVSTDALGLTFLQGAYQLAKDDPAYTARWQTSNTPITFVDVDHATLLAFGKVAPWVQSVFDTLDAVATALQAGEITIRAEIDAAFDAIPPLIGLD